MPDRNSSCQFCRSIESIKAKTARWSRAWTPAMIAPRPKRYAAMNRSLVLQYLSCDLFIMVKICDCKRNSIEHWSPIILRFPESSRLRQGWCEFRKPFHKDLHDWMFARSRRAKSEFESLLNLVTTEAFYGMRIACRFISDCPQESISSSCGNLSRRGQNNNRRFMPFYKCAKERYPDFRNPVTQRP